MLISALSQVAVLFDSQPIRAACFSPNQSEFFALGTNSKSLKFCRLSPQILAPFEGIDPVGPGEDEEDLMQNGIELIQEIHDHHNGSIYCVDWSRSSRLVATGSNDKMVKVLVTPNFDEQ